MGKNDSLLWKITDSEGRESYLFGTMHVKNEVAYALVEKVKPLILNLPAYISELDLSDARLNDISDHLTMQASLKKLLPPKAFKKYARIIEKSFGIDIEYYDYFKPLILTNIIAESVLTGTYEIALDQYLWQFALLNEKTMYGLESAEDQFGTLEKIPIDVQLKGFVAMAKDVGKFRRQILQLNQTYQEQNISKLYRLSKRSMGGLRNLMIYERNRKMVEGLIPIIEKSPAFCAVGAAHLWGGKGMIRSLKHAGYKVNPA